MSSRGLAANPCQSGGEIGKTGSELIFTIRCMTKTLKNLILDYPREAVEFFARAEAGRELHRARIIPIRQEQLTERLGERFREHVVWSIAQAFRETVYKR